MKGVAVVSTRRTMVAASLLVFGLAVCQAPRSSDPLATLDASVIVLNRSQYVIQELRFHQGLAYTTAPNVLPGPFDIEAAHLFHGRGAWYVTVFREKYRGGPTLAFTMSTPMELADGRGYRLDVFDESFRLESAGYIPEHGTFDGGAGGADFDAGAPDAAATRPD